MRSVFGANLLLFSLFTNRFVRLELHSEFAKKVLFLVPKSNTVLSFRHHTKITSLIHSPTEDYVATGDKGYEYEDFAASQLLEEK